MSDYINIDWLYYRHLLQHIVFCLLEMSFMEMNSLIIISKDWDVFSVKKSVRKTNVTIEPLYMHQRCISCRRCWQETPTHFSSLYILLNLKCQKTRNKKTVYPCIIVPHWIIHQLQKQNNFRISGDKHPQTAFMSLSLVLLCLRRSGEITQKTLLHSC